MSVAVSLCLLFYEQSDRRVYNVVLKLNLDTGLAEILGAER